MVFGILGMVAFNLVDAFFVGRVGDVELAALSFTFPVVFIVGSLAMGLGIGAAAVISRAVGRGDREEVQRLTTDALVLSLLAVAVLGGLGLLTIDSVFELLGAGPEIRPLISEYMTIWYPGVIFLVIPMVGNSAIRATGDTRTPSAVMLVAFLINILLDPLLIFGLGPIPALGLAGAALATVIARATTLLVALHVLYRRERMITFKPPPLKVGLRSWQKVLYIGLPNAGANMIYPLGMGVIMRLVSTEGPAAVAAYGVATRIDVFALTVVMALSSVLGPFVGQNVGAGKRDRVERAIRSCQRFALWWGTGALVVLYFFALPIGSLFGESELVASNIALYLWIVPVGYGLQGVLHLSRSALNVLGKPLHAASLSVAHMFVLYVPLAYLGAHFFSLPGVFTAAATANVTTGLIAFLWLRRCLGDKQCGVLSN